MYRLGAKSLRELDSGEFQVHPGLSLMVRTAITITPVDFAVHDGIRTAEEQQEYVRTGVSKTLLSYHLPDIPRNRGKDTEFGQAVDLVPYINGKLRWEWDPIYKIANAMHSCLHLIDSTSRIRWGGVWDRTLDQLDPHNLEMERAQYASRCRARGKRAFSDGPHFQYEHKVFSLL